jgi:glycosyltransferase involved in cell wall biosynthesis
MSRTIVVIPCYNEGQRLDVRAFGHFAANSQGIRFLMVNDGSSDDTSALLRELAARDHRHFDVYDLAQNVGKAEAVRRGLLRAFSQRPEYVAFWDADLATPLEAIAEFRQVLEQHAQIHVVIGARIPLLGRQVERKRLRRLLGNTFVTAASWMLGVSIHDTQCGAKMFRRSAPIESLFDRPFCSRWIFDVEILARLVQSNSPERPNPLQHIVYELPLTRWREVEGSRLRAKDFVNAAFELGTIYRRYRLWRRPRSVQTPDQLTREALAPSSSSKQPAWPPPEDCRDAA